MKNIIKTLVIIIITTITISCSDEYFDVNVPGDSVSSDKTALKDVLGPAIFYTMSAQYSAAVTVSMVNQHTASAFVDQNIDRHYQNSLDGFWSNVYVRALSNIKVVEEKADATNSSHYKAIAQILKAVNIGLATDLYGDVPYTEAVQGISLLNPKYDSQQSIYTAIDNLLTDAITKLSAPNTSVFTPGAEDLIYGGNVSRWIKAAYTFKARYQLHLVKRNGTAAATAALASIANGFTSNADDFQLKYNTIQLNPWHSSQLGLNTGNVSFFISRQLVSYMNGVAFPFASSITMDPRMPIIVDIRNYPNPTTSLTNPDPTVVANYRGAVNGTGGAGSNTRIGIDFFYSKADSPLVVISFAEAKFIQAEANFILAGGNSTSVGVNAATNTAYLAGITANMDKLGVTATAKTAYLADISINKGITSLALKDIMRQKFIALFLNPETFTDYRRYNFSTNVFPNLALPTNPEPLNGGAWIRRFVYPTTERNTNSINYDLNLKPMIAKVWWDI